MHSLASVRSGCFQASPSYSQGWIVSTRALLSSITSQDRRTSSKKVASNNSSGRYKQRNANSKHRYRQQKQNLRSTSFRQEPLSLSRTQIESLWNSFSAADEEIGTENSKGTDHKGFNIESFVAKFPHVNPMLKEEFDMNKTSSTDLGEEQDASSSSRLPSLDVFDPDPVAEEAEQKLQAMLDKIKKHVEESASSNSDMPSGIVNKIQTLLDEELDAVIQMWLRVPSSSIDGHESARDSLAAIRRAAKLLLTFQSLNEGGIKSDTNDSNSETTFFPQYPSLQSYQMVIRNYHQLYRSDRKEGKLSPKDINILLEESSALVKGMRKRVWIIRKKDHVGLDALDHGEDEDGKKSDDLVTPNFIPLNETYSNVIFMHTQLQERQTYSDQKQMVDIASTLLKEMEMLWYDFHLNPPPTRSHPRDNRIHAILMSIHPTSDIFFLVVKGFVEMVKLHRCKLSLLRAVDVFDRMSRRHRAYSEKGVEENAEDVIKHVSKPGLPLYELLLDTYAEMEKVITNTDAEKVLKLIEQMEKDSDINKSYRQMAPNIVRIVNKCKAELEELK